MPEFALTDSEVLSTTHLAAAAAAKVLGVGVATVHRARKRLNVARKMGRPKTLVLNDIPCPTCGVSFTPRSEASQYCSVKCFHKARPPITDDTRSLLALRAKERWANPSHQMLMGIEKRKNKDLSSYRKYRNRLKVLSEKTYLLHESEINPNGYPRGIAGQDGAYHLDHIIPAKFGFEHGIPPEVLAEKTNLQMLPWLDNIQKGSKHDQEG